jgi:hypothetical protein
MLAGMQRAIVAAFAGVFPGCAGVFDLERVRFEAPEDPDAGPPCVARDRSTVTAADVGYNAPADLTYPATTGRESFFISVAGVWAAAGQTGTNATKLAAFDGAGDNTSLAVSSDGLALWVARDDNGSRSVWRSTRSAVDTVAWAAPAQLAIDSVLEPIAASAVVTVGGEHRIVIAEQARIVELASDDGLTWRTLGTIGWSTTGAGYDDSDPSLSPDGCSLVFASTRSGGATTWDLWHAERALDGNFTYPARLDALSTSAEEYCPFQTTSELWFVRRDPPDGTGPHVMTASLE